MVLESEGRSYIHSVRTAQFVRLQAFRGLEHFIIESFQIDGGLKCKLCLGGHRAGGLLSLLLTGGKGF